MITSTQITSNEIVAFIAVLILSYWAVTFCLQTKKTRDTFKK